MPKSGFRAKCARTHAWLYGFPDDAPNGFRSNGAWRLIEPGTICEFTRMHDKYRQPIYEGDIIRVDWMGVGFGIFRVEFKNSAFVAILVRTDQPESEEPITMWDCYLSEFNHGRCEVIGNVYDNPELVIGQPKPTNEQLINSLSTTAQALFLANWSEVFSHLHCDCEDKSEGCDRNGNCTKCIEEWLRSPVSSELTQQLNRMLRDRRMTIADSMQAAYQKVGSSESE